MDIIPNEVIRMIMKKLMYKQRLAVARVCSIWNLLTQTFHVKLGSMFELPFYSRYIHSFNPSGTICIIFYIDQVVILDRYTYIYNIHSYTNEKIYEINWINDMTGYLITYSNFVHIFELN